MARLVCLCNNNRLKIRLGEEEKLKKGKGGNKDATVFGCRRLYFHKLPLHFWCSVCVPQLVQRRGTSYANEAGATAMKKKKSFELGALARDFFQSVGRLRSTCTSASLRGPRFFFSF